MHFAIIIGCIIICAMIIIGGELVSFWERVAEENEWE